MIKIIIGNLFDSNSQTWVNTVNNVGIMGKGIALEFKKQFPEMYNDYVERCNRGEVRLGHPYLYKQLLSTWILNFPTKDHWRSVANLGSIKKGLEYLLFKYEEWGITSLAMPPLGCGEGQLEWRIVGPTLYRYLNKMQIPIELYAPYGTPHEELVPKFLSSSFDSRDSMPDPRWIEPSWIALVEILRRIEDQPYHWPVGRTIFQKIAYVATEQGIPTKLEYKQSSYGPFASKLKNLITRLVNNGLITEERLGKMFAVKVGPTFPDAKKAYSDYLEKWNEKIGKIVDLFMRLNTNQSEIVATVLYAANKLKSKPNEQPKEIDVFNEVLQWKQLRLPIINENDVASTIRNLASLGWLNVIGSQELPLEVEEPFYL